MRCAKGSGVNWTQFNEGLEKYIKDKECDPAHRPMDGLVVHSFREDSLGPYRNLFEAYQQELLKCEDVMISVSWWGDERYDDTNGNGRWDPGEPLEDLDSNGVYSTTPAGGSKMFPRGGGAHMMTAAGVDCDDHYLIVSNPWSTRFGNGHYDPGEDFNDLNWNGTRDPDEPWIDSGRSYQASDRVPIGETYYSTYTGRIVGNRVVLSGGDILAIDGADLCLLEGVKAVSPIPEPSTLFLFASGLAGLLGIVRKKLLKEEKRGHIFTGCCPNVNLTPVTVWPEISSSL